MKDKKTTDISTILTILGTAMLALGVAFLFQDDQMTFGIITIAVGAVFIIIARRNSLKK